MEAPCDLRSSAHCDGTGGVAVHGSAGDWASQSTGLDGAVVGPTPHGIRDRCHLRRSLRYGALLFRCRLRVAGPAT